MLKVKVTWCNVQHRMHFCQYQTISCAGVTGSGCVTCHVHVQAHARTIVMSHCTLYTTLSSLVRCLSCILHSTLCYAHGTHNLLYSTNNHVCSALALEHSCFEFTVEKLTLVTDTVMKSKIDLRDRSQIDYQDSKN